MYKIGCCVNTLMCNGVGMWLLCVTDKAGSWRSHNNICFFFAVSVCVFYMLQTTSGVTGIVNTPTRLTHLVWPEGPTFECSKCWTDIK